MGALKAGCDKYCQCGSHAAAAGADRQHSLHAGSVESWELFRLLTKSL